MLPQSSECCGNPRLLCRGTQDAGKFRSVAERGLADSLAELLRRPFEPVPGSPPARLLRGERIVHIADMAELAQRAADRDR